MNRAYSMRCPASWREQNSTATPGTLTNPKQSTPPRPHAAAKRSAAADHRSRITVHAAKGTAPRVVPARPDFPGHQVDIPACRGNCAAATDGLSAESRRVGRGLFDRDILPGHIQLFGDQHRKRRPHTLTDLRNISATERRQIVSAQAFSPPTLETVITPRKRSDKGNLRVAEDCQDNQRWQRSMGTNNNDSPSGTFRG